MLSVTNFRRRVHCLSTLLGKFIFYPENWPQGYDRAAARAGGRKQWGVQGGLGGLGEFQGGGAKMGKFLPAFGFKLSS